MGWSLSRALGNAWDGVKSAGSAIGSAASATWDTVTDGENWKAAGSAIASGATTAWNEVTDGENWKAIGNGIVEYGEFVISEPGLAARQLGQGLSDSVVSIGGLAVDAVWYTADNLVVKGIGNAARGVYNLGAEEEDRVEYASLDKFFRASDYFEEHTNDWLGYTREQLEEMVENGELDEKFFNDALYTKYAGQAVGEVATFVAVGAATAGTGAAALAMVRGSSLAARTGMALEKVGVVGRIASKPFRWLGTDVAATRGMPYIQRGLSGVDDVVSTARQTGTIGFAQRGLMRATVTPPRLLAEGMNLTGRMANTFLPSRLVNSGFARHITGSLGEGLRFSESTARFFAPWDPRFGGKIAIAMEGGGMMLAGYGAYAKELRRSEEGKLEEGIQEVGETMKTEAEQDSADAIREALRLQRGGGSEGSEDEPIPGTVDDDTPNVQPNFQEQSGEAGESRPRRFNLLGDGTTTSTPLRIEVTPGGSDPELTETPELGNGN